MADSVHIKLQERAAEIIKILNENHWTSACVITMGRFQSMCKGSDEATTILNFLCECGKARYLSIRKEDFIEVDCFDLSVKFMTMHLFCGQL